MAVMMVPMGPGRGFGSATPYQHSCGEKSYRRARLGYISQCLLVEFQHIYLSLEVVMPHMWQVEPPLHREWLPFGGLMRHKRGSRLFSLPLKHLVIWNG